MEQSIFNRRTESLEKNQIAGFDQNEHIKSDQIREM